MTIKSNLNPGFADSLITLLNQADMRPKDLAARIDAPLEVVDACLKGKVPEAEVLYRIAKALNAERMDISLLQRHYPVNKGEI